MDENAFFAHLGAVADAAWAPLQAVYGRDPDKFYGAVIHYRDGGPDPLDGVAYYRHPDRHWHVVTVGLAEHAEKLSGIPDISGWGFELSLRVAFAPDADDATPPPTWPIPMLNAMARYVFEQRTPYRHGEYIQNNKSGYYRRLAVWREPDLAAAETPNGRFEWLQLVPLTEAELARYRADERDEVIAARRARDRWLTIGPTGDL